MGSEIRRNIISRLTRRQLINFLKWKTTIYQEEDLEAYSLSKLRNMVYTVDKINQEEKKKKYSSFLEAISVP